MKRWLRVACATWIFTAASAWAANPLDYTRATLDEARTIVASGQSHDQKLAALSAVFGRFLDTNSMGREALGANWSRFTSAQQGEFLALFRSLMERTYVQKLLLFENPDFAYAGQMRVGDLVRVRTKIITPRDEFSVDYELRPDRDRWLVTRISVEDVNLTANLGSQISDLLSRMSIEDLLALMERKYGGNGKASES